MLADGQFTGVEDGAVETRYVYDQAGRLLSRIDGAGGTATNYAYDGLGRVLSVSSGGIATSVTLYDDANNRTVVTDAGGDSAVSVFDKAGRLVAVTRQGQGTTRYHYDALGRELMSEAPSGTAATRWPTPTIACVPTVAGATYTFTLDYAGALGLAAANTRVGVYVDGIQIGSYAGTSGANTLNWENLSFAFKGNGGTRSLRIQLEGGADTSTAKGAMIDALKVVETLPNSANVAYGFFNATISLPVIGSGIASGDDGATLKTELLGLPEGAVLSDGVRRITVGCNAPGIDLGGWNLAALVLAPPRNFAGSIQLQVRATSVHADNGSTATATRDLMVNVLGGTGCATPVGVNPYVSYLADTAVVAAGATTSIVAGAFAPIVEDAYVMAGVIGDLAPADAADESLEDWMRRLTGSVGDALMGELRRVFG